MMSPDKEEITIKGIQHDVTTPIVMRSSFWITEVLVIAIMPFLYGAVTRLPFIYFVIHLRDHFHLEWYKIGFCVACYQGNRVISCALAIKLPQFSHFLGTVAGLVGFIVVLVCDKDLVVPFVTGTAIIGMSEIVSSMQKYAKEMYKMHPDRKKAQLAIKYQYAFVMIGVAFAFFTGGFVYQYHNIKGVAMFGMILQGLSLIVFFTYIVLPEKNKSYSKEGETTSSLIFPISTTSSHTRSSHAEEEEDEERKKVISHVNNHPAVTKKADTEYIRDDHERDEEEEGTKDVEKGREVEEETKAAVLDNNGKSKTKGAVVVPGDKKDFLGKGADYPYDISNNPHQESTAQEQGGRPRGDQIDKDACWEEFYDESSPVSIMSINDGNSLFGNLDSMIDEANRTYMRSTNIPATWVNWLLCVTIGIEALAIGYNLSIGPIFLATQFNEGTGLIGVFFSIGSACGSIVAISFTCTSVGRKVMKYIAIPPFDLCFAFVGIATGVFVACVPHLAVHVVGLILLMSFNDLGTTLLTELQASVATATMYSTLSPTGQVIRRTLNVVTALTGPVLFGINPRLPYYAVGTFNVFWTILLFALFKFRMEKTSAVISDKTGESCSVSFATGEVLRSTINRFVKV